MFERLMFEYTKELNAHAKEKMPAHFLKKWIASIIEMQGPKDRHLELCYWGDVLIGFLYGKIDHPEHKGFIKPGYGYIMEFYVKPEFRRRGFGREMYQRLEAYFIKDGAKSMYLTSDPVTGDPFWKAIGFRNTGKISPENQQYIWEKEL